MSLPLSRKADIVFGSETDLGPPDVSDYLGSWQNTNTATTRIRKLTIKSTDAGPTIQIWGVAGSNLVDWGVRPAEVFACIEENAVQTASIYANYDFGFMTSALQLRLNKGILPLMSFNVFRDDTGRANYYTREFFRRCAADGQAI